MNKHILFDKLTVAAASFVAGKKKFFSKSAESLTFKELIQEIDIETPDFKGENTYELILKSKKGNLNAAFKIEKWLGFNYPTIIYHHGNNERPFDYGKRAKNSFFKIFVKSRDDFNANLIVVRAPYHDCSLKEYQEKMTILENFMMMITCSVKINEAIIKKIREKSQTPVYTCGISLGGWVTNLHRSLYNTSTFYIPLLAGTFLGELFAESEYRKLTGKAALENLENVRRLLNFNELFLKIKKQNVYPLLAEYDQFIEFRIQKESYRGIDVRIIKTGHITALLNLEIIRKHIFAIVNKKSGKNENT